eukprot:362152-Chlamydomonas_euryale.AAC.2
MGQAPLPSCALCWSADAVVWVEMWRCGDVEMWTVLGASEWLLLTHTCEGRMVGSALGPQLKATRGLPHSAPLSRAAVLSCRRRGGTAQPATCMCGGLLAETAVWRVGQRVCIVLTVRSCAGLGGEGRRSAGGGDWQTLWRVRACKKWGGHCRGAAAVHAVAAMSPLGGAPNRDINGETERQVCPPV